MSVEEVTAQKFNALQNDRRANPPQPKPERGSRRPYRCGYSHLMLANFVSFV